MPKATFITAGLTCLVLTVGCGTQPNTPAGSPTPDAIDQKLAQLHQQWMSNPGSLTPAMKLTATPKPVPSGVYPKEIPIAGLDQRIAYWLGAEHGKKVAVQLAPGVYAERGVSPDLGALDDYGDYAGLCPDVKRYYADHPGGYACW